MGRTALDESYPWPRAQRLALLQTPPQVFDSVEKKFVTRTWADVHVGDVITVFKVSTLRFVDGLSSVHVHLPYNTHLWLCTHACMPYTHTTHADTH